jgi:fucose permease
MRENMGYVSSNMIDLNGPLIQIFLGFLLAIIGCVLMLSAPDLSQISYALFIFAGILVALAAVSLSRG